MRFLKTYLFHPAPFLTVCFFLLLFSGASAQVPSAEVLLKDAQKQAAAEHKNIMVIYHASWCIWCRKMEAAIMAPECAAYFKEHFNIVYLTISESANKKDLENPGARELLDQYKIKPNGIPVWLLLDSEARLLGSSQMNDGTDSGCPATENEVRYFLGELKKADPAMSTNVEQAIYTRFRQNQS
jgi:thiol-disulfide isomerase/thioredoxin